MVFFRKTFIVFCFILYILPTSMLFADWFEGRVISDIRFRGLQNISQSEVTAITAQFIGINYSDELLWNIQNRLFALDFFEDIVPTAIPGNENLSRFDPANTVIIEFNVQEHPVVRRIQVVGNRNIRRNQILDTILLRPGDIITRTRINMDRNNIFDLYFENGFPNVSVTGEIGAIDDSNIADVIFRIDEGAQTRISEIRFQGNSSVPSNTLRRTISTRRQSLFSKGLFLEARIEEDRQAIIRHYRDRGFVDVRVTDVIYELTEDADGNPTNLIITFVIDEGRQYRFGGMTFAGNIIITDEELSRQVRMRPGEILNISRVQADFSRVADLYFDDGYIFNIITMEEIRNEEEGTIAFVVRIVERGRARIENIIIRGNDKTRDHVILRELPFEVGDIFSKRRIIQGIGNLHNLQFFDAIEPDTPPGSVDGLMDLIINVDEGKTIDLQFGLTFTAMAGDLPIMAFATWTDRNFRGHGQELSIGGELSGMTQRLTVGFRENWLMGRRWSGGVSASVTRRTTDRALQDILPPVFPGSDIRDGHVPDPFTGIMVDPRTGEPSDASNAITDYEFALRRGYRIPQSYLMEYQLWDISLGLNTGYTWHTPIGRFNTSTGYVFSRTWVDYDSSIFRPFNEAIRDNYQTWQTIQRVWLSAFWDTRDIVHNPTRGFFLRQSVTYVGGILPSARNYITTNSRGQFFRTLFSIPTFRDWNFRAILGLNSSLAVMFNQFDGSFDATTEDMFHIDGLTMARGWERQFDGQVLWDNWAEIRIPIMARFIWWDFFYSATGMWPDRELFRTFDKHDFLFSLGGGLRLTIPGIPIGFYFVKRHQFIDNNIVWHNGPLFANSLGLDFVIGFTPSFF
ncbi:MAG: outer membrane protein assembly factor BamA [Spirochaetes bacterium]|nr:outer membrane protein assembly factor BamA [Spirochaetota bacterium]